ncbi:dihydroneopterin aldolase [Blattabacterium sp. (Blattella germanica) str. Bge]|uniref:dihydroneopterin aldolase n=1 Tax=Blattabacterium sp. (Blattella germanica) TaxID=624186 RepID=UPI0001BB616E|nr:dihydroneopterin aldolase [Blattabacterium sp. (Blattella germanica)]ACY40312.1 dihydroneopterin aldolase [Blattabacterium sp. (Blattella germanica) str. Bge]
MGKIILDNIRLFGFHGCLSEEKRIGSHYTVNIEIELDFNEASTHDNLSKTIDYVNLYYLVKEEMKIHSKLIEHLAQRIIQRIKKKYKEFLIEIKHIKVKICKENPPIQGNIDRVCVILND